MKGRHEIKIRPNMLQFTCVESALETLRSPAFTLQTALERAQDNRNLVFPAEGGIGILILRTYRSGFFVL